MQAPRKMRLVLLLLLLLLAIEGIEAQVRSRGGWKLLVENAGVSAMHMALTHKNRVIIFDGATAGASNLSQPTGECRTIDSMSMSMSMSSSRSSEEEITDCSAHAVEYDLHSGEIRALTLRSDTWCSSGAILSDGSVLQLGGYDAGSRSVRRLATCSGCDWYESDDSRLAVARWFSSAQLLPDGNVMVVGGRGQFSYEFLPIDSSSSSSSRSGALHELPFLASASDMSQDNLYPFLHLLPDGNVFIFANADSILLDPYGNRILRRFPTMPGGAARNYPSSASSVLLPLDAADGFTSAEILICGGAPAFNFAQSARGNFLNASRSCGRLKVSNASADWSMFDMPSPRIMSDMVLLPPGDVLIVNGAHKGNAGWRNAAAPALAPLLYKPRSSTFQELETASRPRLHHSAAILLPDASVLVGGSNPNTRYTFEAPAAASAGAGVEFFPTDLSLEAFLPPYLDRDYAARRPRIMHLSSTSPPRGSLLTIRFTLRGHFDASTLAVTLVAPPLASHGSSMGQRMLRLDASRVAAAPPPPQHLRITGQVPTYDVPTTLPAAAAAAPSGYYMLFVSHAGLPSHAAWLRLH